MPVAPSLAAIFRDLLRPPGGGIPVYSAGVGQAERIQKSHYEAVTGKRVKPKAEHLAKLWEASWQELDGAQAVVIGIPLDTGAGIRRGAAYGPRGVREELLKMPTYRKMLRSGAIVDLGDVYTNPHLLHDEMLSDRQIRLCQDEMYARTPAAKRRKLPVAPLSQLEFALESLLMAYPHLRIFAIGGDHSVGWPMTKVLAGHYRKTLGIVQPDAHTDLLKSRLGVRYCFGTWSYHANELIGRGGKMVQIGVRQSGRDRGHWETSTGVWQLWADEVKGRKPHSVAAEIVSHLKSLGVRQVYFSNDIDGTDAKYAPATGTPAEKGVSPQLILEVIRALGEAFELVGADVVEVAPPLGPTAAATRKTCKLAARYSLACLQAQLR